MYVYTAGGCYQFDPNSIFVGIFNGTVPLTPLPNEKCMVTGEEAVGFQTNKSKMLLRPDILQRLILLGLEPNEYDVLIANYPDEHYLESDFYWKREAQQSKVEDFDSKLMYTPAKILAEMLKQDAEHYDIDIY